MQPVTCSLFPLKGVIHMHQAKTASGLRYLQDLWDEETARGLDGPELLRYRSNLLGRDLRITNFGGGNTSSKIVQADPLWTGAPSSFSG